MERTPTEVLFIAWHFPPVGGPAVQRSVNFVRHLSGYGYKPVVLTISEEDLKFSDYPKDNSLLDLLPAGTEIVRVPSGEPRGFRKFLLKLRLFRLAWFFFYPLFWERSARWPKHLVPAALELIEKRNIKLVYTTSGPFASALAAYRIRKKKNIRWVADLRDPFTDAYAWQFPGKLHWKLCRRMEKKIFRRADQLIFTAPEARKLFIARGIATPETSTVITNGY